MSTLYLIRHGQASYGQADYDRLSPRGEEQARLLGEWMATQPPPDAVYHGPLRRQRDTARLMLRDGWPAPVEVEGLREYDAESVLRQAMALDPAFALPTEPKAAERLFQQTMRRWLDGHLTPPCGTWHDFSGKVKAALTGIMKTEGRGRRVLAVSSAGPVSVGLQLALQLPDAVALKMSWYVANASITELIWRDDETTLMSFNARPHLTDEKVTYR